MQQLVNGLRSRLQSTEAHMQRLHHMLSPELQEALQDLLKASDKITNAMIEIAMMREFNPLPELLT